MSGLNTEAALAVLEELITDLGEVVFLHHCEGGGPGSGGVVQIYKLGGWYFTRPDDSPYEGPFDELEIALEHLDHALFLDHSSRAVSCTELSADELAQRLTWWPDDDDDPSEEITHSLLVNGEGWTCRFKDGQTTVERMESRNNR